MDSSDYITVFDSSRYEGMWSFLDLEGLVTLIISAILFFVVRPYIHHVIPPCHQKEIKYLRIVRFVASIMALGFFINACGTFAIAIYSRNWVAHILASGDTSYVQGVVENFIPMPFQGHAEESFSVNGVPFSYSDYEINGGFNNSSSHGGPIRQGIHVRIWYVGNNILKMEIKRNDLLSEK